jgi:hypothetical protein
MRASSIVSISVGVGLAVIAAEARAQELLEVADPQTVLDIAKGFGSGELDKDAEGDPMVRGRIQGLKYVIYFYGCAEGKNCRSIQFSTGYTNPFTAEQADEWNETYRWVRAFEREGSNFKMDVDFASGISKAHLEEHFATWESFVPDIKKFVGDN